MGKLLSFMQVTLDGYFAGENGDIAWTHKNDDDTEWKKFVEGNAQGGEGPLVFGRVTYEMMASYWPTPQAKRDAPVVAEGMNRMRKVVFSKTLDKVSWDNTTLLKGDLPAEIRKLKGSGKDMAILGSGSLVAQLTQERLIDEYQIIVNPEVLGRGKTLFAGVLKPLTVKLMQTRAFGNGKVLLTYAL